MAAKFTGHISLKKIPELTGEVAGGAAKGHCARLDGCLLSTLMTLPASLSKRSLVADMTKIKARERKQDAKGEVSYFCPHSSSSPTACPVAEDGYSHP